MMEEVQLFSRIRNLIYKVVDRYSVYSIKRRKRRLAWNSVGCGVQI